MVEEPFKISDSIRDGHERAHRFRAESAQREAEHQRERQARHREQALLIDAEMQELIGRRILRAQEEAKLRSQAEVPPVPICSERQDRELELEQAAGRRALEKYARRNEEARGRISAEEKAKEIPGFKTSP